MKAFYFLTIEPQSTENREPVPGVLAWLLLNALALLSLPFGLSHVLAEDWDQWRGAKRDGVWRESGIVDELPEGQIPLAWSVKIGPGYSGPTVAKGRVYVTDRLVDGKSQQERILCIDEQTGESLWQVAYDCPYTISYTAGPRASVTVFDDLAYAVGAQGHFHCLNAATGAIVWKHDLNAEYEIAMPIWGISGAPLIYQELVIQQVGGTKNACVVAFNRKTGKEVWRALSDRAGYSSPIIVQQAKKDVLVMWTGDSLSGLDPLTGAVYWSHPFKPREMPIGIATPVLNGDMLYVSSFYDGSLMVKLPKERLAVDVLWRRIGDDEKNTDALHCMIGTPIFRGGHIYGIDSYGEMRCLDAKTGDRVWEDLSAVPKARWSTIHMVEQEDRVWMFNERGEVLITKLSPKGLTILDRAKLIEPTKAQLGQRNGVCWSHPAFANQSIYARNDERLVKASLKR